MKAALETETQASVRLVLGVARLGESDLRGWWRSHGLDRAGRYVLSDLFPRTWQQAALELDIASAARLHDELLGRPTALHLFSDHLPFRRWASAWLAEQKTSEPDPLFELLSAWDEAAAMGALREWTVGADISGAEALGSGLLLGTITAAEVAEPGRLHAVARLLASAYLGQEREFRPPYLDMPHP